MDRCPICDVTVKPENVLRHLNDIHPRHPDTPAWVERLKAEPGRVARRPAGAPLRIRRWHVLLVGVILVGGLGTYGLIQLSNPPPAFPCISQEGGLLYHWHARVVIYSGAAPVTIPGGIGLSFLCTEPLHTHDTSGTIHIESDTNRHYSIGDFFAVWRKSFGSPTQMLVNGTAMPPSPTLTLWNQETIELHYATFTP